MVTKYALMGGGVGRGGGWEPVLLYAAHNDKVLPLEMPKSYHLGKLPPTPPLHAPPTPPPHMEITALLSLGTLGLSSVWINLLPC